MQAFSRLFGFAKLIYIKEFYSEQAPIELFYKIIFLNSNKYSEKVFYFVRTYDIISVAEVNPATDILITEARKADI